MSIIRAGDIMIPLDKYPHMPHWFTIRQALAELEHTEFDMGGRRSLPRVVLVFDEEYSLLGMVRRRDILRGIEPEFLASLYRGEAELEGAENAGLRTSEKVLNFIRDRVERPVSEIMMRLETTVDIEDNTVEIARRIVNNNVSLLPVVKEGEVVGVVRTVELVKELARVVF